MSPHMRKLAVQSMVAMMHNRTLELVKEFEEIRTSVANLREKPNKTIVYQTANAVLAELEETGHAAKLQEFCDGLAEILEDVRNADPHDDFKMFIPRIERVEQAAKHHFEHVLPPLHEKLTNALRQQAELN